MVNKDQVGGVMKQAKGAVKEAAGKATGNRADRSRRQGRQDRRQGPEGLWRRQGEDQGRALSASAVQNWHHEGGARAAPFVVGVRHFLPARSTARCRRHVGRNALSAGYYRLERESIAARAVAIGRAGELWCAATRTGNHEINASHPHRDRHVRPDRGAGRPLLGRAGAALARQFQDRLGEAAARRSCGRWASSSAPRPKPTWS